MHPETMYALADDLTGAAEIAAIGRRFGMPARIGWHRGIPWGRPGLTVIDTDTRLESPGCAARKVREALSDFPTGATLYKKVDSVLRGCVVAETESAAQALGKHRILLVPANPALGRTIRSGEYFLNGKRVSETDFRHDPHHPITSAQIHRMLGLSDPGNVRLLSAPARPTEAGLWVGQATSTEDLNTWARAVDADTLPAGGGEFFAAFLRASGLTQVTSPKPPKFESPALLLSGTRAPAEFRATRPRPGQTPAMFSLEAAILQPSAAAERRAFVQQVLATLRSGRNAVIGTSNVRSTNPAAADQIRDTFAEIAQSLAGQSAFRHLVVEGGATAEAVLRALGWTTLEVAHEWAQGVISLHPPEALRLTVTMKPGSYPWPMTFTDAFLG